MDTDGICAGHRDGVVNPLSSMKTKPLFCLAATAASISFWDSWSLGACAAANMEKTTRPTVRMFT
jgi:hypothetical protein